ncbi:MAG: HEAT repeat domain-containing protein [Acidobacteria bacterium]|nr:HEAT repeat domain-containing protein [Acidobacteriota bacterium]
MTSPETPAGAAPSSSRRRWLLVVMMVLVVLFVLVPFLFWRGTWFGRPLTEEEISRYLAQTERPRKVQHALAQIAERMVQGDPSARRWYGEIETLAAHPQPELRVMVAWVMGQDNQAQEFHASLRGLLADPEPMVRRNAALSLVRFSDAAGRPELLNMLRPYLVRAPDTGTLRLRLKVDDPVNPGTLLARIERRRDDQVEVRAPLPGRVEAHLAEDGSTVETGDEIILLAPAPEQVWEALRALYLVGRPEDLPEVERFARGYPGMPESIRQQARLTAGSIENRKSSTEKERN